MRARDPSCPVRRAMSGDECIVSRRGVDLLVRVRKTRNQMRELHATQFDKKYRFTWLCIGIYHDRSSRRCSLASAAIVTLLVFAIGGCEPANQALRVGVLKRSTNRFIVLMCTDDVVTGIGARVESSAPGRQQFYWRITSARPHELTRVMIGSAPRGYVMVKNVRPPLAPKFEVVVNPGGFTHYANFSPDRMRVGQVSWNDGVVLSQEEFRGRACR